MERLNTDILIIGENIHSVLLAQNLRRRGKEILLLAPNSATQVTNTVFKFYREGSRDSLGSYSNNIQSFLAHLGLSFKAGLSPFEALYSTNDIVKVLTLPWINNYYDFACQNGKGLLFVHFENIQYLFNIDTRESIRIYKNRTNDRNRIYSIYEFSGLLEEDESFFNDFITSLEDCGCGENEILVLPPVLGILKTDTIVELIKKRLKMEIFEVLIPNFTISSRRFYLRLREIERIEKIEVLRSGIRGFERKGRLIKKVITQDCEIYTERVVLATGRFAEDGLIIREKKAVEPLFDLPVFFVSSKNHIAYFTNENIFDLQPFLRCGIRVNSDYHPVNESNEVIFENLYSCGTIIQNNYDIISTLSETSRLADLL